MTVHEDYDIFKKKQKRKNQVKGVSIFIIVAVLLLAGHHVIALTALLLSYVIHEVLWSDHIFYDPRQDYSFNLLADSRQPLLLVGERLQLPAGLEKEDTHLIEVMVKAKAMGCIFDPYVEIIVENGQQKSKQKKSARQYFERKSAGIRYLNVSHLLEDYHDVLIVTAHYCTLDSSMNILSFKNPLVGKNKIMVIAPHADDAELAAFSLYSQLNSFIVTLSAGEIEAEYYEHLTDDKAEASRFKGRLRSWDSIVVPKWGGVSDKNVMQLGYFCLTLEQMYQHKDVPVKSHTAGLDDIRYFRIFNPQALESDRNGLPTWNNLVQDLAELMQQFKPEIIITPHPAMDPHEDHRYATVACAEACEKSKISPGCFLLYANHYRYTDMFPFGLSGSAVSLPPLFAPGPGMKIFSYFVDNKSRREKMAAIAMMHDLRTPIGIKKKIRQILQHILLGRDKIQYGDDDYFRKSIRHNELFYQVDIKQLKQFTEVI